MKRIRVDNSQETLILTGMIVSDRFLRDVQVVLNINQFKSTHSRKIARWCVEYYEENGKAPGVHIQDIFNLKSETSQIDPDELQMIARTLDRISSEFDRATNFNVDYVLKRAEAFFGKEDLKNLCEELLEMAETDTLEAIAQLESYRPKKLPTSEGINPFSDHDAILRAFDESSEPIMRLPGALGRIVNPDLCRGSFIGLMGQEKIGKTWNLMEFAFQAAKDRLNVAFFQAGDMNEDQQIRRMQIRLAGRSNKEKYCGDILIPTYDCIHNQNDSCDMEQRYGDLGLDIKDEGGLEMVLGSRDRKLEFFNEMTDDGYMPCDYCRRNRPMNYMGAIWYRKEHKKVLTSREAIKYSRKFDRGLKGRHFKMVTYPSDTLTCSMIRTHLDNWTHYEGYTPDVIIVDYADIMVSEDTKIEHRNQQNKIWKGLRSLSTQYNCLVITATQANADAYGKDTLSMKNFSEDKRKYAHVTSMYTLNQSPKEKAAGIMRVCQLIIRDEDFDANAQVRVMQCFSIGRAHIGSFF